MRRSDLLSDGKDQDLPVLVALRVEEPGLPYGHEKNVEVEAATWERMTAEERQAHLDSLADEFAAEIYETDWEILSEHDINAPVEEE
jgi:hypothetical protein